MIDFGEVERSGHVFKDPAKLEACVLFAYTALPMPPAALQGADAGQLKWWLNLPDHAAERLAKSMPKPSAEELSIEQLRGLVEAACKDGGETASGAREAMMRISSAADCEEYLSQARKMIEALVPFRDMTK